MVGELFLGLLGVAIAIGGAGFALYLEMRKGHGQMGNIIEFLKNSTVSQVDEKIAVIYVLADEVRTWKSSGTNVKLKSARVVSDLTSIGRIYSNMTFEQWRELRKASDLLIENMKKENYDTSEIEYTLKSLM
jgi:hypothetical protein